MIIDIILSSFFNSAIFIYFIVINPSFLSPKNFNYYLK